MNEKDDALRLIQQQCGDIIARIHACRSRVIAVQLRERLCGELAQSCTSPMVQNLLKRHVDQLIEDTFDKTGMNKYLEV